MPMITVNSCCCGCSLETGGLILAWLGMVCSVIPAVLLAFFIIFANFMVSCSQMEANENIHQYFPTSDCFSLKIIITVALTVAMIFFLIPFFVNFFLRRGILDRDAGKIIPALIIQGIGAVLITLRAIISLDILGILICALPLYLTVVLYSLWKKIKDEKQSAHNNVQYSQP